MARRTKRWWSRWIESLTPLPSDRFPSGMSWQTPASEAA